MNLRNCLTIILCIFCSIRANAQSKLYSPKFFLNDLGTPTNSSDATSYIVYSKQSDSLYYLKQYGMDDTIKMYGTFKDARFSVPNGKFIYYYRCVNVPISMIGKMDTLNHVKTIGFFKNGHKDSTWTNYFINGKPENINTFKNDTLNGLSESYNVDTQTILAKGHFVNGLRDGDWNLYNIHGQAIVVETYKKGKKISSKRVADQYVAAVAPDGFAMSFIHKIKDMPKNYDLRGDLTISFVVDKTGDLINFSSKGTVSDPGFKQEVIAAIRDIKGWKPAYMKNTGEMLKDIEIIDMHFADGKLSARLLNSDEINSRFYQFTR